MGLPNVNSRSQSVCKCIHMCAYLCEVCTRVPCSREARSIRREAPTCILLLVVTSTHTTSQACYWLGGLMRNLSCPYDFKEQAPHPDFDLPPTRQPPLKWPTCMQPASAPPLTSLGDRTLLDLPPTQYPETTSDLLLHFETAHLADEQHFLSFASHLICPPHPPGCCPSDTLT